MEVGEYDNLVGERSRHNKTFFQRFKYAIIAVAVLVIALAVVFAVVYTARMKGAGLAWEEDVSVAKIMGHLQKLQLVADANNNTRAAGTSGYESSVMYVQSELQAAGYEVTLQNFTYNRTDIIGTPSSLTIHSACQTIDLPFYSGYVVMGSAGGDYNLDNVLVDTVYNYGCEASDYSAVQPGHVALVARGNCSFSQKAATAAGVNAAAIVIYSQLTSPDPLQAFSMALTSATTLVIFTSYMHGMAMANNSISINISTVITPVWTTNVIADTRVGKSDSVIVVGSHLDSVPAGPGINDNGSGSALNLALAIQLSSSSNQKEIKNKVRFCWWAAEEIGLLGSQFYVSNLNATNVTALREIAVNLNFDMIGSPNFFRGVYNGTNDTQIGSHVVQSLFNGFYASEDLSVQPTAFDGRSDYGPFLAAGIPAGGLFTGAEVFKTVEQKKQYGGLAYAAYDPCYHKACDTYDNINQDAVQDMARGAAYVLQKLAMTEDLLSYLQTPPK